MEKKELLEYVTNNDLQSLQKFLSRNNVQRLNELHFFDGYKIPILYIALKNAKIHASTVAFLINTKNVELYHKPYTNGYQALHWAVQSFNSEKLQIIVDNLKTGKINDKAQNKNALEIILEKGNNIFENNITYKHEFIKCVHILINEGIEYDTGMINILQNADLRKEVKNIFNNYQNLVDLVMQDQNVENNGSSEDPFFKKNETNIEEIFMKKRQLEIKLKSEEKNIIINTDCLNLKIKEDMLLVYLIKKDSMDLVFNIFTFIVILYDECHKIWEKFVQQLKGLNEELLNDFINKKDHDGNTALHIAVKYKFENSEIILDLLELGASVLIMNNDGVKPLEHIDCSILNKFFDTVLVEGSNYNNYARFHNITINYCKIFKISRTDIYEGIKCNFVVEEDSDIELVSNKKKSNQTTEKCKERNQVDVERGQNKCNFVVEEDTAIELVSNKKKSNQTTEQCKEINQVHVERGQNEKNECRVIKRQSDKPINEKNDNYILKLLDEILSEKKLHFLYEHPVIMYLILKKMNDVLLIFFFIAYYHILVFFVFYYYQTDVIGPKVTIFYLIFVLIKAMNWLRTLITIKKSLVISSCWKKRFYIISSNLLNIENVMDMAFVLNFFYMILRKVPSPIGYIFIGVRVILLLSELFEINHIYLVMYKKIIYTFVKCFVIFLCVIYVIVHTLNLTVKQSFPNDKNVTDISFLHAIAMFAGELNLDDKHVNHYQSQIVFGLFIFLITINLLNMLNGLAVNDVQNLLSSAKMSKLKSKVKFLTGIHFYFGLLNNLLIRIKIKRTVIVHEKIQINDEIFTKWCYESYNTTFKNNVDRIMKENCK